VNIVTFRSDHERGAPSTATITARPAIVDVADVRGLPEPAPAVLASQSFEIHIRQRARYGLRREATSRFYVRLPKEAVGMDEPPYSLKGEDEKNDELWRQYNRREVAVMRAMIGTFLKVVGDVTDSSLENLKVSFSRYAGCSCPCSPGFKASRDVKYRGRTVDVWISATAESAQ
jgi:hypothetical protein